MSETLSDPESADSFDVTKTPFNRALRTDLPFFAWLDRPENELALKTFGIAMLGTSNVIPKEGLLQSMPFLGT